MAYPYPKLILLDLKMPGMDGFQALSWLRSHPPHSEVLAVVLTGVGERAFATSLQLGARSFLTKPFNTGDFLSTLKALGFAGAFACGIAYHVLGNPPDLG